MVIVAVVVRAYELVNAGIAGSDLIEEYEAKLDSIVLLKTFDEKRNVYSGDASFEDIAEFVKANQMPLVTEFTDEVGNGLFYLFIY